MNLRSTSDAPCVFKRPRATTFSYKSKRVRSFIKCVSVKGAGGGGGECLNIFLGVHQFLF